MVDDDTKEQFLAHTGWQGAQRRALPGDFSARHYVRLEDNGRKALLMVMPQPAELAAFLNMQRQLDSAGLRVPAIYAAGAESGLSLIEDLGGDDFGSLLRAGGDAQTLYPIAVDALLHLHKAKVSGKNLPHFTPELFMQQTCLFLDVYGKTVLRQPFSHDAEMEFRKAWLDALKLACAMPASLMLRDFHAANIMYLAHETGHRRAAVIDFQDGGVGPMAYDLASLLEDARLDIPSPLRAAMLEIYLEKNPVAQRDEFLRGYHILACQRHLRVLAILARRWAEKDAPNSEDYFKRVWRLLMLHASEPALGAVYAWLHRHIPDDAREMWSPR